MNEYQYIYTKLRKEFGKYCGFDDTDTRILGMVESNLEVSENYAVKDPASAMSTNIPKMSEHSANTERVSTANRGQVHTEGGWPKEVDCQEAQDTTKWRKRLDKDPAFGAAVKTLCGEVEVQVNQNNTIDMFEDYFDGEEVQVQMHSLYANTIAVFKDQSSESEHRTVSKVSWHPEGPHKFVASYSVMRFQRMDESLPRSSFIWDVDNPNVPVGELITPSPLICTQYQLKNPDVLAGGAYNGLVMYFDVRQGSRPVGQSVFESSHYDPIYELLWLQSKTHSECVTVSTDGKVLWWDIRNLQEPTDSCTLTNGDKEDPKILGGSSLEWQQEAGPTKFLVGSEQGVVLSLNKKPKKAAEIGSWFGLEEKGGSGRHTGPVYALRRNPQHIKYFMTVGDWCVKLWLEDLKGPMLQTQFSPHYLTTGAWSPTRAGVFFATRQDGVVDFWDYFYRMNEVAYSHKVTDAAISSASLQSMGRLLALGDTDGIITLLELCEELWQPANNEKNVIGAMFERETRREKNLEAIKKQQAGQAGLTTSKQLGDSEEVDPSSVEIDEEAFFASLKAIG